MKYFNNCIDTASIKKLFRELCLKHHPDLEGGSNETMAEIIKEYKEALKSFDGEKYSFRDEKENKEREGFYKFDDELEQEIIDKMLEISALKAKIHNLKIMLVGKWIWVDGTSKEDKDLLNKKGANLRWSNDKQMWYWRPSNAKKCWFRGNGDFYEMAFKYGYKEFDGKPADKSRMLN